MSNKLVVGYLPDNNSAILLGIAFLDESLLPKHLVGMSLIGAGMAAVDGRPWKKLKVLWAIRES